MGCSWCEGSKRHSRCKSETKSSLKMMKGILLLFLCTCHAQHGKIRSSKSNTKHGRRSACWLFFLSEALLWTQHLLCSTSINPHRIILTLLLDINGRKATCCAIYCNWKWCATWVVANEKNNHGKSWLIINVPFPAPNKIIYDVVTRSDQPRTCKYDVLMPLHHGQLSTLRLSKREDRCQKRWRGRWIFHKTPCAPIYLSAVLRRRWSKSARGMS